MIVNAGGSAGRIFYMNMEPSRLYLKPITPEDAGFLLRLINGIKTLETVRFTH
ncbi:MULTISPECIES: hypothetical protein [unclassified Ekhidna]|jgi:hypothetical protein|uniref:hypothetical protein n=1 Tax=unclassified Ekhidna TaxID=2632188 RepID=UPI0032DE3427